MASADRPLSYASSMGEDYPLLSHSPMTSSVQYNTPPRRPLTPSMKTDSFRMKYYYKLSSTPGTTSFFQPPFHVLPADLFGAPILRVAFGPKHKRLVTIISIWNTMVGSTMLSIPWAFQQSGILLGLILFLCVAAASYYTCVLVIKNGNGEEDFANVCEKVLGKWSKYFAVIVSCAVLIGASMAFHIYMSDCLADIVTGIAGFFGKSVGSGWNTKWAALVVLGIVLPISCAPRMTALVKFNSFGCIFVLLLLSFFTFESGRELSSMHKPLHVEMFRWSTFGRLLGVINLSFFIHNAVLSLLSNGPKETNKSDLGWSFLVAGFCYLIPGVLVGTAFASETIDQNFLLGFSSTNPYAFAARCSVLLQLSTVFPLLQYFVRVQFYGMIRDNVVPSHIFSIGSSVCTCAITTSVAIFYPYVGNVLRFTGAFCGLAYVYILPVFIHLLNRRTEMSGVQKVFSWIAHSFLLLFGFMCLVLQFV